MAKVGVPSKEQEPGSNVRSNVAGWPVDSKERNDFYHRIRMFPPTIRRWRESLVAKVLKERSLFSIGSRGNDLAQIRLLIDEGISHLRAISRILSLVCSYSADQSSDVPLSDSEIADRFADLWRVLARIGPYRELGLDIDGMSVAQAKELLNDIIPPNLRDELCTNLLLHGKKVCAKVAPACSICEIRKFCATFRRNAAVGAGDDSVSVVDLFCGAGGLSEGFRRAGFRVAVAVDNDPVTLKTYRLNHPEVPDKNVLCKDIRELGAKDIVRLMCGRPVEVLIGAPPCQGFSHAGFRCKPTRTRYNVTADDRNYLFEYMVGLCLELRPKLFVMENVPGMHTARHENISFLETAAHLLEKKGGYKTNAWRLNAAEFGVPQDRVRYFLVAARGSVVPAPPVGEYQDRQRINFDVEALPPLTLEHAIFDLPERISDSGQSLDLWERYDSTLADPRYRYYLRKFSLLSKSQLLYNHGARYHNPRDLELYALLKEGENSIDALERYKRRDLMRYRSDVFDDKYQRLCAHRPCRTIVSHLAKDGNGYVHPSQVRSITVREAARVQSFRDEYIFCGSVSDQWIQVGNAVPPMLAEAIAKTLLVTLRNG